MNIPHEIVELIGRFEENLASYTVGTYNETQLRREFIDPFNVKSALMVSSTQN